MVALFTFAGFGAQAALADGSFEVTCPANTGSQICGTSGNNIYRHAAGRCDATVRHIGGTTGKILVSFDAMDIGDGGKPWSPYWLSIGDTYSHSWWTSEVVVPQVWKSQQNKSTTYRVVVTGPCHV